MSSSMHNACISLLYTRLHKRTTCNKPAADLSLFSTWQLCSREQTKKLLLIRGEFFRRPILTNQVAGFLFSLRVARIKSPSGKQALVAISLYHTLLFLRIECKTTIIYLGNNMPVKLKSVYNFIQLLFVYPAGAESLLLYIMSSSSEVRSFKTRVRTHTCLEFLLL